MEIKYTNDGKKVVIVGKLNDTTTIVQEIFITEQGDEIPSGEKFTTTSLHDKPVISWKERDLNAINERYEKEYNKTLANIKELEDRYYKKSSQLRSYLEVFNDVTKNVSSKDFELVLDFISGNITHVLIDEYDRYRIVEFTDKEFNCSYNDDKLKLITLYGDTKGNLNYYLNSYSDGSGCGKKLIFPFKSEKEANDLHSKEKIISSDLLKSAYQFRVVLPKEIILAFHNKSLESLSKKVKESEHNFKESKKQLKEIENKIKKL